MQLLINTVIICTNNKSKENCQTLPRVVQIKKKQTQQKIPDLPQTNKENQHKSYFSDGVLQIFKT